MPLFFPEAFATDGNVARWYVGLHPKAQRFMLLSLIADNPCSTEGRTCGRGAMRGPCISRASGTLEHAGYQLDPLKGASKNAALREGEYRTRSQMKRRDGCPTRGACGTMLAQYGGDFNNIKRMRC